MAGLRAQGLKNILTKAPHDVVFLSALRTPFTRSYKGGLKDTYDHELLYHVLKATLVAIPGLDPTLISDICIGTVLSELGGSKAGRMAALAAGIPTTTSFYTTNRACASGHQAISNIAHQILAGTIDIGIAGGMESMTRNYGSKAIPTQLWAGLRNSEDKDARDCIMPMGITAENVAERWRVSREEQDAFAAQSQARAAAAQAAGLFDAEIIPVPVVPSESTDAQPVTVTRDDGVRKTSIEKLSSLKTVFKENGTVTAGNSSQLTDGATAALMMRRSTAQSLGLTSHIIGKWITTTHVGCSPSEMGIGPLLAIPHLLSQTGLSTPDIGAWEINEAFAAQAVACVRDLSLDESKVNPNGSAIALGHPLGATGGRQLATILPHMRRGGVELGVISACVGTGMGTAKLIAAE